MAFTPESSVTSCSRDTGRFEASSSEGREAGGMTTPFASTGTNREPHGCAFCNGELPFIFNAKNCRKQSNSQYETATPGNGDTVIITREGRREYSIRLEQDEGESEHIQDNITNSRGEPNPRLEKGKAEQNDVDTISTCRGRRWMERTPAGERQCLTTVGDLLFYSPVLLWLLSPYLYLNELTKLRLLSRSISRRWLFPWMVRWMMSNSMAMVFPAQWAQLSQPPDTTSQDIPYPYKQVSRSSPIFLTEEKNQKQQSQQVDKPQETQGHLEREQHQDQEPDTDNNQQRRRRRLRQMEIESSQEDTRATKEEQENCIHEDLRTYPKAVDVKGYNSQELYAEEQISLNSRDPEIRRRYEHVSDNACVNANSVPKSLDGPVVVCGMSADVGGGGSETSVRPAGDPANVAAFLSNKNHSCGTSTLLSAYPEENRRPQRKSVSLEVCTATGELGNKREEGTSAVQGSRKELEEEEAAEKLITNKEPQDAGRLRIRCPTCNCKSFHPFNVLRSVLLRHPVTYGCAPLQLRQLTLHMPEASDAVISLKKFQAYKTLLEICSPTLEELHLYDFSSFCAVIDIVPAIDDEADTGNSKTAAVEADEKKFLPASVRNLKETLRTVRLAFNSVFDPVEPFAPPAEVDINEEEVAENAAADLLQNTASEGNSASAGDSESSGETASATRQHLNAFMSAQKWKLTLSFKMWEHCQRANEEDPVDDDERQGWGPMNERDEFHDGDFLSSIGKTNSTESCHFYTVNSYADPVSTRNSDSSSSPAADFCTTACASPALSNGIATVIESAADIYSFPGSSDSGNVSESSLRLTKLQGDINKRKAAVPQVATHSQEERGSMSSSLPPTSSPTPGGVLNERPFGAADNSATEQREDMTSIRRDGKGSIEANAISDVSQESSVLNNGTRGSVYSSRLSDSVSSGSLADKEFFLNTAGANAVKDTDNFHQGTYSSNRAVQCEFTRIPTRSDVFQFLHENVSRLQLRCCFPRLRYLQIYGSSSWQTVRPHYSCLACLFLPRDGGRQKLRQVDNFHAGNEDGSVGNQAESSSSRSSHRSENIADSQNSVAFEEACSSRRNSSAQNHDRDTSRSVCSKSQQSQNSNTQSRSESCVDKNASRRTSRTPERRRSEEQGGNAFSKGEALTEGQNSTSFLSKDHVGADVREITGVLFDGCEASDAVKKEIGKTTAIAVEEEERKAKTGLEELAFPALEEFYWHDASCVGEDMLKLLVASRSERLRKLSFSTYDATTITCVLRACVIHPRLFRGLQELVIDGLNFIWPEDEWWWFSGNSWFRFVEIWRLHAMGRSRLAPPYPVPHTLQQLRAQRLQREQQLYSQRRRPVYISTYTELNAQQQTENQSQYPHAARKKEENGGWKEEGGITGISTTDFHKTETGKEKEGREQSREIVYLGSEKTDDRGHRYATGPTISCEKRIGINEDALTCCRNRTVVADQREVRSGWGTIQSSGDREVHSKGWENRRRSGAAMERQICRKVWPWDDDWACSTDEDEESQSAEEVQPLPVGFEGSGSEVDYEGIQHALDRLPRVRKLRFLNFVGQMLREPSDSTHILSSFFPEADIEIQGSVFVGRRVFQRLLMKAFRRDTRVRECEKKPELSTIKGTTDRDTSRRRRSCGIIRNGGVEGTHRRRLRKERRAPVRSQLLSESDIEVYSSDDTVSGRLVDFAASPFRASTSQKISRSRSASMVLGMPGTVSRVDGPRDWRHFIRGAVQLSPLAEQRLCRWLRQGLVYKLHMKLAVDWTDRAILRVDGFHRECVAVYVSKVLDCLTEWMRKGCAKGREHRCLRILELLDCFDGSSDKWPEGVEDERGYFVPFGRAREVLEYFTPFLLGLDCFTEEIFIRPSDFDDDDNGEGESVSVGAGEESATEDGGTSDPLLDGDEHEGSDNISENVTNVDAQQHTDEQSNRRSDRVTEREPIRVLERRRTIHVDHDVARSVSMAGMSYEGLGGAMQQFRFTEKWNDADDGTESGTCRGRAHRDTELGSLTKELGSVPPVLLSAAHEANVNTSVAEREAGEEVKETSGGGFQEEHHEDVAGCGGAPGSVMESTVGFQSTDEVVAASAAAGGYQAERNQAITSGVPKPYGHAPDSSRRILRLQGVAGLAMPLYTRFSDFRKQSYLVMKVARAYQAQTRVLVVTDSTLLFYRRCKEFYDNALAALARDFKAITETCKKSLLIVDYRVYRPYAWQCELGDSQDKACMPSFIQTFLRNNPEFRLARRLDAIRPVENEVENGLEKVKTALTAYIWMKSL